MSSSIIDSLTALGAQQRKLDEGAYLFHRGDAVERLFVVVEGKVDLIRRQESGKALTLQRALPGNILAEASLFSESYHCDAVAAEASTVLAIPKERLRQQLRANASLSELWTGYLARQVQQARFRSELLALRTVAERLDMWLAWRDGGLPERGQWRAVADEIGTSPEALYRELARRRL